MFNATEIQLPLSVIISNGKTMNIALPEYIRIQLCFLQNLFVVLQNLLIYCMNCVKEVRLKPDQPNQWLRACS